MNIEAKCGEEFVRGSLHTANWEKAQLQAATAEGRGWWKLPPAGSETREQRSAKIADARGRFLSNAANALKLSAPTLRRYATAFKRLTSFATAKGLTRLSEFDVEILRDWQESWQLGPRTIQKEIERVRSFFKFWHQANHIQDNPARLMRGPKKVKLIPKLPFTPDEMQRILSSASEIDLAAEGASRSAPTERRNLVC
jgi:integrase